MSTYKVRVVLKVSKGNVPLFLACCKAVCAAMTAHAAAYAGAPITMAAFLVLIQNLEAGQAQVRTRVIGAAAARNEARDALVVAVEQLRVFVQTLCAASPQSAATLAANAGMKLAAVPVRAKPVLGVKEGPQGGSVVLTANVQLLDKGKAGKCFNWEYSLDGKTWIAVPTTPLSTTTIGGLTPLTTYSFRVSVTTKKVQGLWSQDVSFLVR